MIDCLVVSGGPAGLVAATYLVRFRRKIRLIDAGQSRAAMIPESHNYPGFQGIGGRALLDRLREQACRFGLAPEHGEVTALEHQQDGTFVAQRGNQRIHAQRVLLATGIVDRAPCIRRVQVRPSSVPSLAYP
jgi:thioredoxin reductase (NADPH)